MMSRWSRPLMAASAGVAGGLLVATLVGIQPAQVVIQTPGERLAEIDLVTFFVLNALFGVIYLQLWGKEYSADMPDRLMASLVYGVIWWLLIALVVIPLAGGHPPRWHVQAAADALPALISAIGQGIWVALTLPPLLRWRQQAAAESIPPIRKPTARRIVILGGGFAGVTVARQLEHLLRDDEGTEIVLVSETNYLLFTPMLSEVVGGSVEPQHISTPLRTFFRRTRLIQARIHQVDLAHREVKLAAGTPPQFVSLSYHHLVLAVGAVPDFFGNHSVERHAFPFKSLGDAIRLRDHIIEQLERADATPDSAMRRALLTFMVAGGGFAGVELAGALNDFVRGALRFYPNILPEEISLYLVHSRERLLPELSPALAEFARRKLTERGVIVKLHSRVTTATAGYVMLDSGEGYPAQTLIWTAGNRANPLVATLKLKTDPRGRIQTDSTLAVPGHPGLWAVGDCAAIPNRATGEIAPPTAQHATRAAAVLAYNIWATLHGRPPKTFAHRNVGALAVLGHQTACAELYGICFAGMLAWWLWRGIYLAKLPTLQKKFRVSLDWLVDLFFPRDIVELATIPGAHLRPASATLAAPAENRRAEK